MKRQALVVFVILNVVISIGVALLVIELLGDRQNEVIIVQTVPIPIVVTATPLPGQATQPAAAVGGQNAFTPVAPPGDPGAADASGNATVDPVDILPDIATEAALTLTAFAQSGPDSSAAGGTYTVQSGDNPSFIAENLGVTLEDLLCINNLGTVDDPAFIFPGQQLLVPGPDFVCNTLAIEPTATDTPQAAAPLATVNPNLLTTSTPIPTVTLAATAANAQITITRVIGAGDVTSEAVEIRNSGGLVDLGGWTLADTQGNSYTFPDYRLFPNAGVTVYSRVGVDTPVALFWGQSSAVWEIGDVVTLTNADGQAQSTFRVVQASQ